jgi:hypothetical protein
MYLRHPRKSINLEFRKALSDGPFGMVRPEKGNQHRRAGLLDKQDCHTVA